MLMTGLNDFTKESEDGVLTDEIIYKADIPAIRKRLSFHLPQEQINETIQKILRIVVPIVRPQAAYKPCKVESLGVESFKIEKVIFTNLMLKNQLGQVDSVFPFIATCGNEVDSIDTQNFSENDLYCYTVIKEMVMFSALDHLQNILKHRYSLDYIFYLTPGEFQGWKIKDRKRLLTIMGHAHEKLGVKIRKDFSLKPEKTLVGLFYSVPFNLESCQLCQKNPCMGRRAVYNESLLKLYLDKPEELKKIITGCSNIYTGLK
jgi:hypothetical protein